MSLDLYEYVWYEFSLSASVAAVNITKTPLGKKEWQFVHVSVAVKLLLIRSLRLPSPIYKLRRA